MTRWSPAPAPIDGPPCLRNGQERALAFVAILVGGLSGGLIGWAVADLECGPPTPRSTLTDASEGPLGDSDDGCTTWSAVGGLAGALVGAGGVGVVAVLVLRAMAEWRRTLDVEPPPTG